MNVERAVKIMLCLFFISLTAHGQQLAFPGAEGYGKYASGGRGGRIVEVVNLDDVNRFGQTQPGTLRAALNTEGNDPITIVFRVSGVIELKTELKSGRSNMTIAGQTAPGEGICIKNASIKLSGDNLIIRYLRFRPGDELKNQASGLNIENAKNIIVDHCSMSWAIEENATFYDTKNVTVQWCIISEGLYNSFHSKGPRGYGGQWGGQYSSYHHNLLAHNRSRSPRINGSRAHDTMAVVDFRNNVIFNWGSSGAIYGGEEEIPGGECKTNFVNNYYKPGPATPGKLLFAAPSYVTEGNEPQGYAEWYFSGNYMEGVEGGMNDDNWLGVDADRVGSIENIRTDTEIEVSPITTQSPQEAYEAVLANAGAILPIRDEVDSRIIAGVKGETDITGNGIIDSQEEVGGWPEYISLDPPEDSDKDGIPDEWETKNGLDPNNADDGKMIADNGYSHLENYLNSITETEIVLSVEPGEVAGEFHLYPNPSVDKVYLSSEKRLQSINVYDLKGVLKLSKNLSAAKENYLNVDSLETGAYILRAIFTDGKATERKLIVH